MPSKRYFDQLKSARTAAIKACKKRKSEASLVLNVYLKVEDHKLSTTGTSNIEGESGTWFWNESAKKSDSDIEEEEDEDEEDEDKNKKKKNNNQEERKFRTQKVVSLVVPKIEIKWNRQGDNKF